MYERQFGLSRRPFRSTPDIESYYPASTHERALSVLVQAIADDEGLQLLVGEPGTGKTLLCHRLLERLDKNTTVVFLTNSHFSSRAGLLQAILYDLSLPYEGRSEQELRLALTDYLLQNYSSARRAVLLLDEAHHLDCDLLEELRLLGNLETGTGKAIQVVLVAQPAIMRTLQRPELAGFNQRLMTRVRLEPLGFEESVDYLLHHLRAAGGRPHKIVSEDALDIIVRGTRGLPRLLGQAAHQAFTLAWTAGADQVDAEAVIEALAVLGLEDSSEHESLGPGESISTCAQDAMEDEKEPGTEASEAPEETFALHAVGSEPEDGPNPGLASQGHDGPIGAPLASPRKPA